MHSKTSPPQPADDTTSAVSLRYAKNTPDSNAVTSPKLLIGAAGAERVAPPEKWIAYLREHRTEIETEWARLTRVLTCWDELATSPRIGGRMLADMALRSLSKVAKTCGDIDDLRLAFLARLRA